MTDRTPSSFPAPDLSDPLKYLDEAFPEAATLESPSRWVAATGALTPLARTVQKLVWMYAVSLPFGLSVYWMDNLGQLLMAGYVGAVLHITILDYLLHCFFGRERIKALSWRRFQQALSKDSGTPS